MILTPAVFTVRGLRLWGLLFASAVAIALAPSSALAAAFGTDEEIIALADVGLQGPEGEALAIAFKTTVQNFGAGLFLTDDGYVLIRRNNTNRYFHMPEGEELADFQRRGLLPNPLPPYEIGWPRYVMGYSLWLVLLFASAFAWGPNLWRRARGRAV